MNSKGNSRTTNTFYNFISSIGGQLLAISMQFVIRTVFIATLGKSYLGINGLFSNILSVLSLAEFGVGSAILFKLYDPIAKKNYRRITILMKFYKNVYRIIGICVAVIGLCLIPFLPVLISDYNRLQALNINAPLIYCLFLFKSVSSYLFFAYRSAIIQANQKEYYINLISYAFTIGAGIVQIICLLLFGNFILYVIISIMQVIGQNLACAILAEKLYPYIIDKTDDVIKKTEIIEIIKDCGALFLYKLNGVVLKATDNIVISMFIGLEAVGEYSNYYIFYTTINSLFASVYNSVSHSLGNLHTDNDRQHEYRIFKSVILITALLGGTAFVGIFVCADELVNCWIGSEWILDQPFSMLMGLEIYTLAFRIALSKYRTTMGLFQQAKWRPLFGMIINLVVSVGLVRYWGICGVLAGTIVADWSTMMWYDPIIIHRYGFENERSVWGYYRKFLKYFLIISFTAYADYFICSLLLVGYGWLSVIVHAFICGISVPAVLIMTNITTAEGQYVLGLAKTYCNKIKKRLN